MGKNPFPSEVITYDKGTFQLLVQYKITASGIKFCPWVNVGTKGGFDHTHTLVFHWSGRKKADTRKGVNGKKRYYPDPGKKAKQWEEYKGNELTVTAYMKKSKGTKNSKTAAVNIKSDIGPGQPGDISVSPLAGRNTSARVVCANLPGRPAAPILRMKWERLKETLSSGSWSQVGSEYTVNAYSNTKPWYCTLDDLDLDAGSRYKWRVSVANNNGSGGGEKTAIKESSGWYYTNPPAVQNVSHVRLDDSTNIVYFSRNPRYITLHMIKGYRIEYNCRDTNDPWFNSGWTVLNNWSDYNIHPGQSGGSMTEQFENVAIKHTGCSKDTRYRYRICTYNRAFDTSGDWGWSEWSATSGDTPTYNTPNKPNKLSAVANADVSQITLTIEAARPKNPSSSTINTTADKIFIQRKGDNGTWVDIPSAEGIDIGSVDVSSNGLKYTYVDSDIDDLLGQNVTYRAAFGCSSTTINGESPRQLEQNHGKSAWSSEETVSLLAKPNKPNLIMPVNDAKIVNDTTSVRLAWIHSPKDGTAQEDVKIEVKVNSGSWTNISNNFTPEQKKLAYYDLALSNYQVNDVIHWRVSTKGAHKDFSDPTEKSFKILDKPTLTITTLSNFQTVSILPITIGWSYSDLSGTIAELYLDIKKNDKTLHTIKIDTATLPEPNRYVLSQYIYEDETNYTFSLRSVSTSGVDAMDEREINIQYTTLQLNNGYSISSSFDENTGYVDISVERVINDVEQEGDDGEYIDSFDDDTIVSNARVRKFYVYRVYNGIGELVQDAVQTINLDEYNDKTSFSFIDKLAPVNSDFTYKLLQITELGEVSVSYGLTQNYETLWWYVYWGENNIIKTRWNPQGSGSMTRPQRQEVRYSGREYPVIYDSQANEESYTYTFTILKDEPIENEDDLTGKEVLEQFKSMMRNGGKGVWKSFEGDVYYAKFDFSYSSNYSDMLPAWSCTLSISRMDNENKGVGIDELAW